MENGKSTILRKDLQKTLCLFKLEEMNCNHETIMVELRRKEVEI